MPSFSNAFICSSVALYFLKKIQKRMAAAIAVQERPVYIHTSLGSLAVGEMAIPRTEPNAVVKRNMDIMNDFMLGGALVKAYSRPVIEVKISESPIKRYAG